MAHFLRAYEPWIISAGMLAHVASGTRPSPGRCERNNCGLAATHVTGGSTCAAGLWASTGVCYAVL